ncbi:hypothetical protein KIPB_014310, partial [Kipferlia bialata]|eukprot:g14310.t1
MPDYDYEYSDESGFYDGDSSIVVTEGRTVDETYQQLDP